MKRIIALLLALFMLLSLAACGGDKAEKNSDRPNDIPAENESALKNSTLEGRECIEMGLFQVYYPDGWNYYEDSLKQEETAARVTFYDGGDWDTAENKVYMYATEEDAYRYRSELNDYNVDLKEFAAGNIEKQTVGNTEFCYIAADNFLIYRHEPSGITYKIDLAADRNDESVKSLLEGVILTLKETGNIEAPWPWEGEAFQPVLTEQMAGSFTITPEYIPFEQPQGVMDIMDYKFYQIGEQVFILLNDKLDTYEYSDNGLKFVSSVRLSKKCEYISEGSDGVLYLSPGIGEVIGVKDGEQVLASAVKGDLSMHPSGTWGIAFWLGNDTQRITVQDGVFVSEPWVLTGLNKPEDRQGPFTMVKEIDISDSHIMISGTAAVGDSTREKMFVYDLNGNQLLELGANETGNPDSLGSITAMAETSNGYVAIDGNMREIQFWSRDGIHLGCTSARDIFGADYPWLEDMQLLEDGSLLILATQKRDDGSANELMFFKLTGF